MGKIYPKLLKEPLSLLLKKKKKKDIMGHPWWSSSGCALPVQGAQVLPPVGELRSHRLHLAANKKKGVDITGIISKKQNLK